MCDVHTISSQYQAIEVSREISSVDLLLLTKEVGVGRWDAQRTRTSLGLFACKTYNSSNILQEYTIAYLLGLNKEVYV